MNELTKTLLSKETLTEQETMELGKKVTKAYRDSQFQMGLIFLNTAYGDKKAMCEEMGWNYNTVTNYASFARKILKNRDIFLDTDDGLRVTFGHWMGILQYGKIDQDEKMAALIIVL